MNSTTSTASGSDRWRGMARELGLVIGRSDRPVCFLLGAGASISSGGPSTTTVVEAFTGATERRFDGMDLMRAVALLEEREKQEILAPLFEGITPAGGYHAVAAIAAYLPVVVLNLNWDNAMAQAAKAKGVLKASFDIMTEPTTWPNLIRNEPGLVDIHLHGKIGEVCRFGTLETLMFETPAVEYLVAHGLEQTMACLGASLNGENDLPSLFRNHLRARRDATPPPHWYFVRGEDVVDAQDRLRQGLFQAPLLTSTKGEDVDFDVVATLIADTALPGLHVRRARGR